MVSTRKKRRAASVAAMERMSEETPTRKKKGEKVGRGGSAGHRSPPGSFPGAGRRVRGRGRSRSRSRSDSGGGGEGDGSGMGSSVSGGKEVKGDAGDGATGGDAGANDELGEGRRGKKTKREERTAKKTKGAISESKSKSKSKSKTPIHRRPRSGSTAEDVDGKDSRTRANRPDGTLSEEVSKKVADRVKVAGDVRKVARANNRHERETVRRFVSSVVETMPAESVSALLLAEGGDNTGRTTNPRVRVLLERTASSLPPDDPIRTALLRELDVAAAELTRCLRLRRMRTLRDELASGYLKLSASAEPGCSGVSSRVGQGDGEEEREWTTSLAQYLVSLWSDPYLYCKLLGNDNDGAAIGPNHTTSVALRDSAAILSVAVSTGGEGRPSRTVRCARLIRALGEELGTLFSRGENGKISMDEIWEVCYHVVTTSDLDRRKMSSLPDHRVVPRDRRGIGLTHWADTLLLDRDRGGGPSSDVRGRHEGVGDSLRSGGGNGDGSDEDEEGGPAIGDTLGPDEDAADGDPTGDERPLFVLDTLGQTRHG